MKSITACLAWFGMTRAKRNFGGVSAEPAAHELDLASVACSDADNRIGATMRTHTDLLKFAMPVPQSPQLLFTRMFL
jgi:hypothetical protein